MKDNAHDHETALPAGSLIIVYGKEAVDDIPGTLKSQYTQKDPQGRRYRFGVKIGLNYLIEYGLTRSEVLILVRRLLEWLQIDPHRGEYIEYESIPNAT